MTDYECPGCGVTYRVGNPHIQNRSETFRCSHKRSHGVCGQRFWTGGKWDHTRAVVSGVHGPARVGIYEADLPT